jgi:16S rRNA C1402 (ribose-2'-O) methylase RsmI
MNLLAKSSKEKSPLVILDTPYRLKQILESCSRIFPKGRLAFLAMDITGEQETYIAGTFKKLLQKKTLIEKKLNFVLIVSGES